MSPLDSRWARLTLAIVSGVALYFAFAPWDFEVAAWIWSLPILTVLWIGRPMGHLKTLLLGWITGFAFFLPNLSWLRHSSRVIAGAIDHSWAGWGPELMGWSAVLGMSGFLSIYIALWAWFTAKVTRPEAKRIGSEDWMICSLESLRSAFLSAAAWVGLEWLRGIVFTGFGWNGLAVGLHKNIVLIQVADLIGVTGVSFLPIFIACIGFNTLVRILWTYQGKSKRTFRADFSVAMLLLLGVVNYGWQKMNEPPSGDQVEVRTVLVQQNVPQAVKWSGEKTVEIYHRYAELTALYASHADLIVWPESALPLPVYSHPDHPAYFDELLAKGPFSLLTGADVIEPDAPAYTSAMLLRDRFEDAVFYHKMHLVPFGEYLPFRKEVPLIDTLLGGILPGDFTPGTIAEPVKLQSPAIDIIPLICFEDTVGRLARKFVRDGPQLIVNLTNDGWFLQSAEMEQHLANAVFRSIELRRPMCRASNTGPSCFIDVLGRVTQKLVDPNTGSQFIEGCLPGKVALAQHPPLTLYARWGDWFSMTLLLTAVIAFAIRLFKQRSNRARPS